MKILIILAATFSYLALCLNGQQTPTKPQVNNSSPVNFNGQTQSKTPENKQGQTN